MTGGSVIVTGGTGYVGRFIIGRLLNEGRTVIVGGRTPPATDCFKRPVTFVEMKLGEPVAKGVFDSVDYLVHAAFDHLPGKYRGGEGDDAEGFRRPNLHGSIALFEAAKAAGVGKVVFLSSRAVYGVQQPGVELEEDKPPRPDTLYGEVKLAAERHLLGMADESFRPAVLRVTGVYGQSAPGSDHKWRKLIDDYLAGNPVPSRVATEVHGADLGQAVSAVLDVSSGAGLFNVSDLLVDHHDLLAIVKELTSCKQALPDRADATALNVMDTGKLRALGWCPGGRGLFEKTVRQMVQDRGSHSDSTR